MWIPRVYLFMRKTIPLSNWRNLRSTVNERSIFNVVKNNTVSYHREFVRLVIHGTRLVGGTFDGVSFMSVCLNNDNRETNIPAQVPGWGYVKNLLRGEQVWMLSRQYRGDILHDPWTSTSLWTADAGISTRSSLNLPLLWLGGLKSTGTVRCGTGAGRSYQGKGAGT